MLLDLTLCLLLRDNEQELKERLLSLFQYFSTVIVVDTGSTDGTLNLLQKSSAQVIECPFNNDFASLRNLYLDQVKTEWVLSLDSDEYIDPENFEKLSALVEKSNDDTWGYNLKVAIYHNQSNRKDYYFSRQWSLLDQTHLGASIEERLILFRGNNSIRYRGIVHESVFKGILEAEKRIERADVVIHNYGYPSQIKGVNRKQEFYHHLIEKQLTITPDEPKYLFELAKSYSGMGKHDNALQNLDKLLSVKPNLFEGWFLKGKLLFDQGKEEEASEALAMSCSDGRYRGEAMFLMAKHRLKKRDFKKANEFFEVSFSNLPNKEEICWEIIRSFSGECLYVEGLPWFSRLKSTNPERLPYYYYFGVFLHKVHKLLESEEAFKKAITFEAHHSPSFIQLITVLVQQGKIEEALDYLKELASFDPHNKDLPLLLRQIKENFNIH